ncbi:hypothetical protein SPRG_05507 [Saprolegnia parasitica CBS 223.65]|uniref:Uncharacterized protein n=1 Tax=Saprolegnia parasitica (strain CBS 223.65) TaxID=695850 RepID=A0A067CSN4_SAPPC|nr:hypothetical protein SPRG_05507 [Saprolegnia parasitica CBS 223.65]KDO29551.1 hypothetical protein SPRG_05507 [Saprolegnia parasitica CBS 223.65]|eukprot:XP_012199616.1 hypothetical protein SPRG_05507 [Saprolegnia parasitica CBS 223.65]
MDCLDLVRKRLGPLYFLGSVALSLLALSVMQPYLENDYLWPSFASSLVPTALVQAFNTQLSLMAANATFDLLDPSMTVLLPSRDVLSVGPAYARRIVHEELTAPAHAIASLRSYDVAGLTYLMSGYCWADLRQRYSLAHTSLRETRCASHYAKNGAVYLEAVLRNVNFAVWYDAFGSQFDMYIARPIQSDFNDGRAWVVSLHAHAPLAIPDEVAVWASHQISIFQLQYANRVQTGLLETIGIGNALGQSPRLSLKAVPSVRRGSFWTTIYLFAGLQTDFASLQPNQSLVRNTSEFFGHSNPNQLEEYNNGVPLNLISSVLHAELGQLTSIDVMWLPVPPPLRIAVQSFHTAVQSAVASNPAFPALLAAMSTVTVTLTPELWQGPNYRFYGGSPLCSFGAPLAIAQESFGFDDVCAAQRPLALTLTPLASLFGMALTPTSHGPSMCHQVAPTEKTMCLSAFTATVAALAELKYAMQPTRFASSLSLMQFVSINGSHPTIEVLPLLDPSFAYFGGIYLYDWVHDDREAVSFQGDATTLTLISKQYTRLELSPTVISTDLSAYLYRCAAITTVGVLVVAAVLLVLGLYHRAQHAEWFYLNRLLGPVWLSRSILAGRSIAATIALATTDVFVVQSHLQRTLRADTKPLLTTSLLAGEVLWLTYLAHDILHPVLQKKTHQYASPRPLPFRSSLARECFAVNVDEMVYCNSGTVDIGTFQRTLLLVLLTIGVVAIGALLALCSRSTKLPVVPLGMPSPGARAIPSLILPVAAVAFLHERQPNHAYIALDALTSACCGLFHFRFRGHMYLFDTKSWLLVPAASFGFETPGLHRQATTTTLVLPHVQPSTPPMPQTPPARSQSWFARTYQKIRRCMGVPSLLLSLFSNVAYLGVAQSNLANDYSWSGFNATGTYTFLGNLFNRRLLTQTLDTGFALDDPALADVSRLYNLSVGAISVTGHAARRQLFSPDVALEDVVANLRRMDACRLPWMFTQYCFVDLRRRWSLASSAAREARCGTQSYVSNGAVYFETSLGNVPSYADWTRCWGTPFEMGIASALATSIDGRQWLSEIQSNARSCVDEAVYWRQAGVSGFSLQWQNFKTTGFSDAFYIENALGLQYSLPLSSTPGAYHLTQQNSMRMYWSLASDLWAIATNATLLGSASLVRQSPRFAYANTTPIAVLFQNLTLVPPLNAGLVSLETSLGPFGNVDMVYVPVPASLSALYANFTASLARLLLANTDAAALFADLPARPYIIEVPGSLLSQSNELMSMGGRLMCGNDAPPYPFMYGIATLFGTSSMCYALFPEYMQPTTSQLLFALLGYRASIQVPDVDAICSLDTGATASCAREYTATLTFLDAYHGALAPLHVAATRVHDIVYDQNVSLVQYLLNTTSSSVFLYTINILAPEVAWPYYGWCFLYEWATGVREVVSYEGDVGRITAISAPLPFDSISPSPDAIARSLSLVCQGCVQYITVVLIAVASGAILTALWHRGRVETVNLMVLTRLGGLVWIGRPFLLLRSLTAVWLLNTSPLFLVQTHGYLTRFESPPLVWYNTVLAASELTWSVFILNDVFSCVTQEYTVLYSSHSTNAAWLAAILWTFQWPQQHVARLHRSCIAVDMDFAIDCHSGSVEIGNVNRVFVGYGIGAIAALVCYAVARLVHRPVVPSRATSLLLNAQCMFMLRMAHHDGGVFLDKMSALIAGVLTWERNGVLHLLDVKTWRYLCVKRDGKHATLPARVRGAIPLSSV